MSGSEERLKPPGMGEQQGEKAQSVDSNEQVAKPRFSFMSLDPEEKMRRQEDEIRQLRGKIRGYETLGIQPGHFSFSKI